MKLLSFTFSQRVLCEKKVSEPLWCLGDMKHPSCLTYILAHVINNSCLRALTTSQHLLVTACTDLPEISRRGDHPEARDVEERSQHHQETRRCRVTKRTAFPKGTLTNGPRLGEDLDPGCAARGRQARGCRGLEIALRRRPGGTCAGRSLPAPLFPSRPRRPAVRPRQPRPAPAVRASVRPPPTPSPGSPARRRQPAVRPPVRAPEPTRRARGGGGV